MTAQASVLPKPLQRRPGARCGLSLGGYLRLAIVISGLLSAWARRAHMNPDGTAYADIAKAYLRGDWAEALNSYWSPLYSWLLAGTFAVFPPGIRHEIAITHVVNFVGLLMTVIAWEFLLRQWENWQGPPAHPTLMTILGLGTFAWTTLGLNGMYFNSADIFVVAIMLAIGGMLTRFRRGEGRDRDAIFLGCLLALSFFAKAAIAVLIPVCWITLAVFFGTLVHRRLVLCACTTISLLAPFIVALSVANGQLTISTSGKLNYSWEVTGSKVEGYKESGAWLPDVALSRAPRVLLNDPRVISFDTHMVGTVPPHSEPAWWSKGYPAQLNWSRQLTVLKQNAGYSLLLIAGCPGLWVCGICCLTRRRREIFRQFRLLWFLWLPAAIVFAGYCAVYVLPRYLSAPYALLGFTWVVATWKLRFTPEKAQLLAGLGSVCLLIVSGIELVVVPTMAVAHPSRYFPACDEGNLAIAEFLAAQGLRPGHRVAVIGAYLDAAWAGMNGTQIVAAIPAREWHDDAEFGRPLKFDFERSDRFWAMDPATRERVFDAFRSVGARWAVARDIPQWADVSEWQLAGPGCLKATDRKAFIYVKNLQLLP